MRANLVVCAVVASFTLTPAGEARADLEGRPCGPENELIEYGELITCEITPPGDSDLFRFVGITGEVVSVRAVDQRGRASSPGVFLELLRPDLTLLASASAGGAAVIDTALDQTGEFTVRVTETGSDQTMAYTLVLDRLAPASPSAVPIAPAETISNQMISPIGDVDLFVFQGASGDAVSLRATDLAGLASTPGVLLELFRPDGTLLDAASAGGTAVVDTTLDQTGLFTVRVNEAGHDQEMTYNLEYQCLAGTCSTQPRPVCEIGLNQQTFVVGDVVTADVFHIANPTNAGVDLRLWFTAPGFPPAAAASLVIPAGFDQELGPVPLFSVTPAFPLGTYGLNCRMMSTVTGETLVIDLNSFELQ